MMIEFDEYKTKLNNLKPRLEDLSVSLNLEADREELERLHTQIEAPGFWDNQETSQKVMKRASQLEAKAERFDYAFRDKCVEDRDLEALEMYTMKLLMGIDQ